MSQSYDQVRVESAVRKWQEKERDKLFDLVLSFFENGLWYETGRWCIMGYDQDDLVQIGCLAILRAMDTWDPAKGCTFKSHAWNYVKRDLIDLKATSSVREATVSEQLWDTEILGDICEDESDAYEDIICRYEIERLPLRERERVVLESLIEGEDKQDIAKKLGLSPMTISWDVKGLKSNRALQELLGQ